MSDQSGRTPVDAPPSSSGSSGGIPATCVDSISTASASTASAVADQTQADIVLARRASARARRSTGNGSVRRHASDGVRDVWAVLGRDACQGSSISIDELAEGMRVLELPLTPTIVEEIFKEADRNGDGALDYAEMIEYVRQRENELADTFARLTANGSDDISFADLKAELHSLGVMANDRQIARFLARLDTDDSGTVSQAEFSAFVSLLPRVDVAAAFESWLAARVGGLDTGAEPGQVESSAVTNEPVAAQASSQAVFLSGAIAGVISRTATAPLDRLKMLMQVGTKWAPVRPEGVVEGLLAIYRQGGSPAFFQGNTANCIKVMPESGVKFLAYDAAKVVFCADVRRPRMHERLMAGASAGAASCIAIYPLEVAKTRLAVASAGMYDGIAHCLRLTIQHEGVGALYKGLGASLIGIIPFSAVDLALYNTFKAEMRRHRRSEPDTLTMLGCGAVSSSLAQLATYPLALAKTRLQASGMPGFHTRYEGLAGCLMDTFQSDGIKGLYRGIVPNLLKAVPSISISYVVFENAKAALTLRGWSKG